MIKLLELFGGIGACSAALDRLGIEYEIADYVEIDKYAVASYNAIHGTSFEPQDISKWDKDIKVDLIMHGSPCFRKGELVNTIDGLRPIETLEVGDLVKTHEGKYMPITQTFVSKSNELIDIKASCTHLINTTQNHPFYVYRDGEYQWVEAGKLTTDDYLCVPIDVEVDNKFEYSNLSDGFNTVTTANKQFAYSVGEKVLNTFRIPYTITKSNDSEYVVSWNKVYDSTLHFVQNGYLHSRITAITPLDRVDTVYNIEVKDVHTYCVNNVAVHNCQDFSIAGLGRGGNEGSGTRSSLMYETIRIVKKLKPKYVVWENVKNLLSDTHIHNFSRYLQTMESFGYANYYKVMNSKDYGVPQNRERIFTVSILGGNAYDFPEEFPLEIRLKDILEPIVDERYYLSDRALKGFYKHNEHHIAKGTGFIFKPKNPDEDVASCLRANAALSATDNTIAEPIDPYIVASRGRQLNVENGDDTWYQTLEPRTDGITNTLTSVDKDNYVAEPTCIKLGNPSPSGVSQCNDVYAIDGIYPTICAGTHGNANPSILTENEPTLTQVGQLYGTDAEPNPQAGRVYSVDGISPTMDTCSGGNRMPKVLIENEDDPREVTELQRAVCNKAIEDGLVQPNDVIEYTYSNARLSEMENGYINTQNKQDNSVMSTLVTKPEKLGVCVSDSGLPSNVRIRKLTPLECWRLQGFSDEYFKRAASVNSDTQLYKQAGNSITVDVLYYIIQNLLYGKPDDGKDYNTSTGQFKLF